MLFEFFANPVSGSVGHLPQTPGKFFKNVVGINIVIE